MWIARPWSRATLHEIPIWHMWPTRWLRSNGGAETLVLRIWWWDSQERGRHMVVVESLRWPLSNAERIVRWIFAERVFEASWNSYLRLGEKRGFEELGNTIWNRHESQIVLFKSCSTNLKVDESTITDRRLLTVVGLCSLDTFRWTSFVFPHKLGRFGCFKVSVDLRRMWNSRCLMHQHNCFIHFWSSTLLPLCRNFASCCFIGPPPLLRPSLTTRCFLRSTNHPRVAPWVIFEYRGILVLISTKLVWNSLSGHLSFSSISEFNRLLTNV